MKATFSARQRWVMCLAAAMRTADVGIGSPAASTVLDMSPILPCRPAKSKLELQNQGFLLKVRVCAPNRTFARGFRLPRSPIASTLVSRRRSGEEAIRLQELDYRPNEPFGLKPK
ncbi:hypothetical protein BHM03_00056578 [Ensete ventricosum]|nr:hypothetical protein BHM03_00056578 [Ensete ventricosum]